jgi:excinuclease ABC subunit C
MARPIFAEDALDLGPSQYCGTEFIPFYVRGKTARQLHSEVRRLCPRKPGVYGMVDANGDVIYVGKGKSLRGRLLSYFRPKRERRAGRIARQTSAIVWEAWPCEFAALLRELELIRRWRPRCNVQGQPLRRRMAFVCLEGAPAAYASLRRRPPDSVSARFGPVVAGPQAREAIRRLNDYFQLRDCPAPQEMVFRGDRHMSGPMRRRLHADGLPGACALRLRVPGTPR